MAESVWERATKDTRRDILDTIWYQVATVIVFAVGGLIVAFATPANASPKLQGMWGVVGALGSAFVLLIGIFFWNLFRAPYRQRDEFKKKVGELEDKRLPLIEVFPVVGQPTSPYETNNKTAWAELKIKNSSSVEVLQDVSVQIVELVQVLEYQNNRGSYFLYLGDTWNPANVYWSERNVPANQLSTLIAPGATKFALIAYHLDSGPALGYLNTPTHPPILESKIVVEISSPSSPTYRGTYYIEYHPPSQDAFEFVEWDSWRNTHNVIEQPTPGKAGSPNV